ncbi:MAG: hypothetical protein RR949_08415, partial [Oscillospiraceae bacterium]
SDGKEYTLLAVVPRSAGYKKEWAGNFRVGDGTGTGNGVHEGFADARKIVLDFAKQYVTDHHIGGDVKLWTAGYSRGAGVTNLVSAALIDDPNCLGFTLKPENLYSYTFGTPSTVPAGPKFSPDDPKYKGIFSVYGDNDIIIMTLVAAENFVRYGTTIELPVHDAATKSRMLGFLKNANREIYDLYTVPDSSLDPDNFSPKKIAAGGGLQLENDTADVTPAEKTQKDFLNGRTTFLAHTILPNRAAYAATDAGVYVGSYQYAIETFAELLFGLSGEDMGRFGAGMGAEPSLQFTAMLLYSYYVATRSTPLIQDDVDYYKGLTNNGIKAALNAGINAVNTANPGRVDEATKEKVTNDLVTLPLIKLIAYMLFGSKDERLD